jgi:hypothetical protein
MNAILRRLLRGLAASAAMIGLVMAFLFASATPAAAERDRGVRYHDPDDYIVICWVSSVFGDSTDEGTVTEMATSMAVMYDAETRAVTLRGESYWDGCTSAPDPGPKPDMQTVPHLFVEEVPPSGSEPTCDVPVQHWDGGYTKYRAPIDAVVNEAGDGWTIIYSDTTYNVLNEPFDKGLTEEELAECRGPKPADTIEELSAWSTDAPSCTEPTVIQLQHIRVTPSVPTADGTDWEDGIPYEKTRDRTVHLPEDELAECPDGTDPGSDPGPGTDPGNGTGSNGGSNPDPVQAPSTQPAAPSATSEPVTALPVAGAGTLVRDNTAEMLAGGAFVALFIAVSLHVASRRKTTGAGNFA